MQLFLCGGIALAVWAMTGERDRAAPAFVAGIVLGASVATRVDALVALVALPLWMSALWLDSPRRYARRLLVLGIGSAIGIGIATVDLLWRSRPYYELHRSEILSQVALFGLAVKYLPIFPAGQHHEKTEPRPLGATPVLGHAGD